MRVLGIPFGASALACNLVGTESRSDGASRCKSTNQKPRSERLCPCRDCDRLFALLRRRREPRLRSELGLASSVAPSCLPILPQVQLWPKNSVQNPFFSTRGRWLMLNGHSANSLRRAAHVCLSAMVPASAEPSRGIVQARAESTRADIRHNATLHQSQKSSGPMGEAKRPAFPSPSEAPKCPVSPRLAELSTA